MGDDQLFRWILAAMFVVVLPIGIYHRIKSNLGGEPLDRRQEGWFILIGLRLAGLVTGIGIVAWMIDAAWIHRFALPLPLGLRWVGVAMMALFAVLIVWVFRSIGTNITDTVVTRAEHELITSGPYRWIRHPLYTALLISVIGGTLVTANWYYVVTGGVVFLLISLRTRIEEEKLIERFGDRYRTYMQRTGRFFPGA